MVNAEAEATQRARRARTVFIILELSVSSVIVVVVVWQTIKIVVEKYYGALPGLLGSSFLQSPLSLSLASFVRKWRPLAGAVKEN